MSSPSDSPTTTKLYKNKARRVSFNISSSKTPPSPPVGFLPPATSKPSRYHHRHGLDRRSRVDDVDDVDDHPVPRKFKAPLSRAKTVDGPTITASQAAGEGSGNPGSAPPHTSGYGFGQNITNVNPGNPAAQPISTNINPALSVNPIYTHLNNGFPAGLPVGYPGVYPGIAVQQPLGSQPFNFATTAATMAAAEPVGAGVTFIPTVPDASNGPMLHTYIPRADAFPMSMQGPGGVVYVQSQPGFNTTGGIPLTTYPVTAGGIATTTAPMIPFVTQQPGMAQPVFVQTPQVTYGGIGQAPAVMMMPGGGGAPMPGNYGSIHPEPALGIGQTQSEVLQEQLEFAYANNLYEPQDFKPADDDKSRHYWVRELDGNWTQRSRATIDHIGCRWYITDSGVFYAVRLPN